MYRKTTNDWQKHADFILLDILMILVAIWVSVSIRNGFGTFHMYKIYREMCVIAVITDVLYTAAAKPYSGIIYRSMTDEIRPAALQVMAVTIGFLFYCFAIQSTQAVSRKATAFFMAYAFCLILGEREILKYLIKKKSPNRMPREVLIAANYGDALDFTDRLQAYAPTGFEATGIILLGARVRNRKINGIPIIARNFESAAEYIDENVVDEIILIDPEEDSIFTELLEACEEAGLTTHIILKEARGELGDRTLEQIAGLNSISSCMKLVSGTDQLIKRTVDILGGIVGLAITGILFVFVAPAIYIADPGPIFFKQIRIGKNGRKFSIYKFRSMYLDAEERKESLMGRNEMQGQIFKIKDDPRIIGSGPDGTRKGIGWFIRAFSIDEFPQFLNVLKGDMSLVGTRPPTLDEWEQYEKRHRKRMRVKPGITGLWQISGRSEITDFEDIVALDARYIREWSFWLDIKIILKTIAVVLTKSGAE